MSAYIIPYDTTYSKKDEESDSEDEEEEINLDDIWNEEKRQELYTEFDIHPEDISPWEGGRPTDIQMSLEFKLNQVAEWFTSERNQGLFAKKDGKIFMPISVNPIKITGLMFNKYLEFEPSIMNYDNGDQAIGVRMYINSDTNSVFMEIGRFLGFKDFIENFNMYQSAQLMLNYLQRPEYGEYLYDIETKSYNTPKPKNTNKFLK